MTIYVTIPCRHENISDYWDEETGEAKKKCNKIEGKSFTDKEAATAYAEKRAEMLPVHLQSTHTFIAVEVSPVLEARLKPQNHGMTLQQRREKGNSGY